MDCQACDTPNADTSRFCESCGAGLRRTCTACGHECRPGARFCGGCGVPLGGGQGAAAPRPTVAWGELKLATILFADIVSSTEHIAGLDPEQAMEHLRPALTQMCGAIESFGGTVVRTLGDGVMAVFGVPRALEGHASLACEAALAMQAAFPHHQGQGLSIRIGLHSGQVASDPQATDAAIGGGVHGHAIHLASRVVGQAEPGGICLTAACQALVRATCETQSIGMRSLKGIAEPVEIHALLGLKNQLDKHNFHQAALSSFRGRKRELVTLQDALRRAESGFGAVVGLSGAPGTGKSRICYEFSQWCDAQGVIVSEVRTQLYGHATPLQPVLALLRTCFFQIATSDDPSVARTRISQRLSELGPVAADDLALLHEFLGVTAQDAPACMLQPKARRLRLLALVRELAMHCGAAASVIIFEDLHWLDDASEEFLAVLVDAVARTRTLLLLNYRPSYRAPWAAQPHVQQMNIAQLGIEDTEELVRELLGTRSEFDEAFSLIVERSAGNPFFAEELVHSLVESRVMAGKQGKPSLALIAQALPPTVQAVIGERIDRLVGTQKALLHICAVIGKEIPLAVLEHVAIYLSSQLESGLDSLCEAELLQLLREITGDRKFAFRHPLIQEVAYSSQLKTRRADLHAAVAVAMESHYRAQPDEFAALIAYHYEAAGQSAKAAEHEARAAQWLGATNSTQAMRHWRKARELLLDQPRSPEVDRLRVRIGCGSVYLGWREGMRPDEVQQITRETVELATEVDGRLIQLLFLAEGRILQGTGGPADDYVRSLEKAIALMPDGGDVGRNATMNAALSHAYTWAGLLEKGLAANDVALQGVGAIDKLDRDFFGFDIRQWVLGVRVRLLVRMNRLDEAERCLRLLFETIDPAHDPVIRQMAHHLHAELAWSQNDVALAGHHASSVSRIAQTNGSSYTRALDLWTAGIAELTASDFDSAGAGLVRAHELISSTQVGVEFEAEILAGLAECHHGAGNHEQALHVARQAVDTARRRSNRVAECRALIAWAGALARSSAAAAHEDAQAVLEQARGLIAVTGARMCEPALEREQAFLSQRQMQSG